jgi:putative ABC transport system substrate-binding protein
MPSRLVLRATLMLGLFAAPLAATQPATKIPRIADLPVVAAHQVRAGDHPQDRQGAWADDPAVGARARRRDPPVISRRGFIASLATLMAPLVAQAQQPKRVPRIGFLSAGFPAPMSARLGAFQQGLRGLGYVEGKNIVIEYRYAEGELDRLPALAAELVRLEVDVIVTGGSPVTRAAKDATKSIPIVMAQDSDPVGTGFVASLARPGGNITGLSNLSPDLSGKRLELLKEIVPKFSRVAVLGTSIEPATAQEMELAAGVLGAKLQFLDVQHPKDLATAFRAASERRADAVLVQASAVFSAHRTQVAELAVKSRLPAMYSAPEYVEAGGLVTYGVSVADLWRRAATYVDKILRGARPADLPVEQPTKFELVINLKTAKALGLTIPSSVLARADEIIR